MADGLKSPWLDFGKVPMSSADPGGDSITQRGSEPMVDTGGSSGLQPIWTEKQIVPTPGGEESANSVSNLPLQPVRFEPSETPPAMPDLTTRNPGTIDKK